MANLRYTAICSLDGYVVDEQENFDWAAPDEEVHAFVNDLERPVGTHLYGRRMYEVLVAWETMPTGPDQPAVIRDFAELWRAADKVVYSTAARASSARTRIERAFELVGGGTRALPDDVRLDLQLLDEHRSAAAWCTSTTASAGDRGLASARVRGTDVEQAGEARSARVESVRALAALAVVLTHVVGAAYQADIPDDLPHRVLFSGTFAVYPFFVLSGYLLYRPFAEATFGSGTRVDVGRYARNRALRILPLYYVVLVVYLLVREDGGSLEQWLVFGTFSENFARSTVLDVNPVLWSLVIELHFYVLLPLLAIVVSRASRGSLRAAAGVVVALGLASFALRWVTLYDASGEPDPFLRYSLPSCFMFFATGMALALLRLAWERRRPPALDGWPGASSTWVAAGAAVWLVMAVGTGRGHLAAPASFLFVGACVLPLRESSLVRALDWRPLALVGVASYSLYLWHVLLIEQVYRHGVRSLLPLLAVSIPICIGVALASYAAVERPFLRLRRRWAPPAVRAAPARAT